MTKTDLAPLSEKDYQVLETMRAPKRGTMQWRPHPDGLDGFFEVPGSGVRADAGQMARLVAHDLIRAQGVEYVITWRGLQALRALPTPEAQL